MKELISTKKSKKKARKRRYKNENKWIGYKIASAIFFMISIIAFIISSVIIDKSNYEVKDTWDVIFAASVVIGFAIRFLMTKAASHWIQDRLNERIKVEDGKLNHFLQVSFAAGYNTYNGGRQAYLYVMDISTITNAKYDEKSGRIEFKCNGEGKHYSDYLQNIIDKEWALNGFEAIFYDSTTPSLYDILKSQGVEFEVGTINYKFTNQI